MLRDLVGDRAFFEGIRAFYRRHRHGNATTADFRAAIETSSRRRLEWFFRHVFGIPDVSVFDAVTRSRTTVPSMAFARYYPSAITLGDGRVLTIAGNGDASCSGCSIPVPEVYDPTLNAWSSLTAANLTLPYYPQLFLLPDGKVIVTGTSEENVPTYLLDMSSQSWATFDPAVIDGGSSVMYLPGKIMKTGIAGSPNSSTAGTRTAHVIDMNAPAPAWRQVQSMAFPRAQHMLTTLPDGTVLVTGGGTNSNAADVSTAVYEAEIWNPATETWTTMARMQTPRMYHATSLLLPDGRVLVAGGGRVGFPDQLSAEIYSPPYLFKGPRPVITTAPSAIQYAATFPLETASAAGIRKVSLLKLGATTHAFNNEQRLRIGRDPDRWCRKQQRLHRRRHLDGRPLRLRPRVQRYEQHRDDR
jgi:hypothetical protein